LREHFDAVVGSRWLVPIGLPLLVLLSLFVRSRQLHAGFWIDEGISVGIAHEQARPPPPPPASLACKLV
jgi:hypothetical protein